MVRGARARFCVRFGEASPQPRALAGPFCFEAAFLCELLDAGDALRHRVLDAARRQQRGVGNRSLAKQHERCAPFVECLVADAVYGAIGGILRQQRDALVALAQRTVYLVPWPGGIDGWRTLVNRDGIAALPLFTDLSQLETAGRRFGWLDPTGKVPHAETGARAALPPPLPPPLDTLPPEPAGRGVWTTVTLPPSMTLQPRFCASAALLVYSLPQRQTRSCACAGSEASEANEAMRDTTRDEVFMVL